MPRRRTWASKLAALVTWAVSLLLLERLTHSPGTSSVILVTAVAVAGLIAATKLWFHNCFESQLLVSLVTGATLVGTLLSLTVGLPGAGRSAITTIPMALIILTVVSLVLQNADAKLRRSDRTPPLTPPYAS